MNIMTGCLAATSGKVQICGHDIFEQAEQAKRCIGYLPEQPPLYADMTPTEFLTFVGEAKGLRGADLRQNVERVLRETQLSEMQNRLIANLSKGYRQRVGIAQAMIGDPKVIILDEPTVGLDPAQVMEIRELIRRLGKKKTVILSSHILSEINAVCNHVIILSNGKIVADDNITVLKQYLSAEHNLSLRIKGSKEKIERVLHSFPELRNIAFLGSTDRVFDCRVGADAFPDELLERIFLAFAQAEMPILSMMAAQTSLEDVFLRLTDGRASAPKKEIKKEEA
jgi:ABC-2 type transport system ATP-binding protein